MGKATKEIVKTDERIQQDVLCELDCDPRIRAPDVGVEVNRGVVTLTGRVDSWARKVAAQEDAHAVVGVLDVANNLTIDPPGGAPNDTEIAQAVRRALEWDALVAHDKIQSTVERGQVTLTGKVERLQESIDAERAICNLQGVRAVVNRIEIEFSPADAKTVRKSVEDALARTAAEDAKRIAINVSDGVVALTGSVHSTADRQAAIRAAGTARGVRRVDAQRLEVRPFGP